MLGGALWHACARLQSVVRWTKDDVPCGICILERSRSCSFSSCRVVYLEHLHPPACRSHQFNRCPESTIIFDVALGQREGRLGGHRFGTRPQFRPYTGDQRAARSLDCTVKSANYLSYISWGSENAKLWMGETRWMKTGQSL